MAITQDHQTAWKKSLLARTGEVELVLDEDEQHATGIQIDVDGVTSGPITVQYTPIQAIVTNGGLKKTPISNSFTDANGLYIWPIKCWKLWINLSGAGAGPFDLHVVGFKS